MLQKQSMAIKQELSQIVDMLILNGTLTECPGLIHGKMGIAIFFFYYARYTDNQLFVNYAFDLIEEIQSQIHVNSPADYEKGIAGIGVGIEYLIQNKFLEVEEDICEELDQRMARSVLYDPWQDFSLYSGLIGYGRYWISRLRHKASSILAWKCLSCIVERIIESIPNMPIDEQIDIYCFLYDLRKAIGLERYRKLIPKKQEWSFQLTNINCFFPRLGNSIVGRSVLEFQCNYYFERVLERRIDNTLGQALDFDIKKVPISMGLLEGYAGEGLLRLETINKMDVSWKMLL